MGKNVANQIKVLNEVDVNTHSNVSESIERKKITKQELQMLLPDYQVTKEDVKEVNAVLNNETSEHFSIFLGMMCEYRDVLGAKECNNFSEYIDAIKFVGYCVGGMDIVEAYTKVKSRNRDILEMKLRGDEELGRLARMYAKSKLIVKLNAAMDYPLHLLFAGYRHQAIEVLRHEMLNAKMSRDKISAADKLLVHLAPQLETINNNVFINADQVAISPINQYKEAFELLANNKAELLEGKKSIEEIETIINFNPSAVSRNADKKEQ